MSHVWLLRAFATSSLASPRSEGALTPLLPLLRTQPRGSYDCLAVEWPELRAFLAAHEL